MHVSSSRHASGRPLRRALAACLTAALVGVGLVSVAAPADAAAGPAAVALPSGFPSWYEDTAGNRVEACLDANDPNCVLPLASATWDPSQPLDYVANFPDEFFYAYAASDKVATDGCNGASVPGSAVLVVALEGAFGTADGAPTAGQNIVFGRIRVKVTSGLCPNTSYTFRHPFGTVTLTTDGTGAIPVRNAAATEDVGCLAGAAAPCDYTLATASRVFGDAAHGGFLRWDTGAPVGYLGDGATLHAITGGTQRNTFEIVTTGTTPTTVAATNLFTVAGKLTGSLVSRPNPLDFGGVVTGTTSAAQTLTITNLDKASIAIGGNAVRLRNRNAGFGIQSTTCNNTTLVRDASCTVSVTAKPGTTGLVRDFVDVTYTGGLAATRSPLGVEVRATGIATGNQPAITTTPASPIAYGDVRIRTSSSKTISVRNSGTAPLKVSAVSLTDGALGADASEYRVVSQTCVGATVAVGGTCNVVLAFQPFVRGSHPATLVLTSNVSGGVTNLALTGNATGGVAAVSGVTDPADGFPTWYRDENAVTLAQCIDPKDPYCVVLPDASFDPAKPVNFLADSTQPVNFPGEFFYTVADSDLISTPGCGASPPGKAAMRAAIEGTFFGGAPVPNEQMVFGRLRIYVTSGLCANTTYTFTTPYGRTTMTTNSKGGIARARGTEDIGCAPVAPALCDFSLALSAPIFGGVLRWDPAVAPAAPAGYLGDAASFHRVVGAPFKEDGTTPSNYFKISNGATVVGQTNLFSVSGKLRGPLEATGGVDAKGVAALGTTPVGSTSATHTITLTNTGVAVPGVNDGSLTVTSAAVSGVDAADFSVVADHCSTQKLLASDTAAGVAAGTCTIDVAFSPTATGARSAAITVRHSGVNDPFAVPVSGVGGDATGGAAISFAPRALDFGPLKVGRVSSVETVTISNAGGLSDLVVSSVAPGGAGAGQYVVVNNGCATVAPDGSCTVKVAFAPSAAGAAPATLVVSDNAAGGTHSIPLGGSGFGGSKDVTATVTADGFPTYYQDGNGVRLEPCLDPQNCIVLGADTAQPISIASGNFPSEFFYAIADSELLTLPGCTVNGVTGPGGTALLRVGLEGSFANGVPDPNAQITFTRIRLTVKGGLCANAEYVAVTPYGPFHFTVDGSGNLAANPGTQDVGCGAATCDWRVALGSPGTKYPQSATPIDGFLRWDPNVATPPAGYLGDATSFQPVTGGTYVDPAHEGAFNAFEIRYTTNETIARTDRFLVAGKVAGPLMASTPKVDFGNVDTGAASVATSVTVTNIGTSGTAVTPTLAGVDAGQFQISGGTCAPGSSVAVDATCSVSVRFAPTTAGSKNATLVLTPTTGRTVTVAVTGTANAVAAPVASVSPGVLAFGTITAPGSATLATTVTNTGAATLSVSKAEATGDYAVGTVTCSTGSTLASIASGGSCTVPVTFKPTATGTRTGTLTFTHNAAGGSTVVSLTGSGAAATWSISPNPVGFGTVNRGSVKTQTLSVKNTGTASATIVAAGTVVTGTGFAVDYNPAVSTCFATAVAAGRSCNITVSFSPTAAQTYTGTFTLDGGTTSLPRTVSVAVSGSGK